MIINFKKYIITSMIVLFGWAANAYQIPISTSNTNQWLVSATGVTNAVPFRYVDYFQGIGISPVTYTSGLMEAGYLNGQDPAMFDGYWTASFSFYVPTTAAGAFLVLNNIYCDDRGIVLLNGDTIYSCGWACSVSCSSNSLLGQMVIGDDQEPVPYLFSKIYTNNLTSTLGSYSNTLPTSALGRTNTLTFIINNTTFGCGIGGNLTNINPSGNVTSLSLTGFVWYPPSLIIKTISNTNVLYSSNSIPSNVNVSLNTNWFLTTWFKGNINFSFNTLNNPSPGYVSISAGTGWGRIWFDYNNTMISSTIHDIDNPQWPVDGNWHFLILYRNETFIGFSIDDIYTVENCAAVSNIFQLYNYSSANVRDFELHSNQRIQSINMIYDNRYGIHPIVNNSLVSLSEYDTNIWMLEYTQDFVNWSTASTSLSYLTISKSPSYIYNYTTNIILPVTEKAFFRARRQ